MLKNNSERTSASTNSQIVAEFEQRTMRSRESHLEARDVFPSGIVHDSRFMKPYPLYIERAEGCWKWDVDGNKYVDYYGGHGSLLLGHAHESMVEAVNTQVSLGTHPAGCHDLEFRWGCLVKQLIPSAESVRFTASGTEANLLAIRLARAFTGKNKLVRFKNHFHGWQDHVAFGSKFAGTENIPGIIDGIVENVIVADPGDPVAVRDLLQSHDDIAAVILEPTGASSGQIPVGQDFVEMLREVTKTAGILLLFDEVVTGFRVSPGGAQAAMGVMPDLTSLAKILSGGLPGGAVCGRRDIMELLDFEVTEARGIEKIPHQGTFNANPLSAATGTAILEQVANNGVTELANDQGRKLKAASNQVFADEGLDWAVYGRGSCVYFFTNPDGLDIDPLNFDPSEYPISVMEKAGDHPAAKLFRLALLVNGVDINSKPGALVSTAHTDDAINETAEATRRAVRMLKAEELVPA